MKRVGQLYPGICSFESLLAAAHRARKGKRYKTGCREFFLDLEKELLRLQRELKDQSYRPGPYRTFKIYEGKERMISAAPFRDRVVHHALVAALEPIFEPGFIYDSYANRVGKGTHKAIDRFTQFARKRKYVLKCDVKKFFPNVDHRVLFKVIARKIKDPQVMRLVSVILQSWESRQAPSPYFPDDDLFTPLERPRGLPIGNLTSHFWANVYLNPLDHFVKESLGCKHYIRYMDDFVLFHDQKETLWLWRKDIIGFLQTLRLRLHDNRAQVWPVECGSDFLGFVIWPDHRRLRGVNVRRFRRRLHRQAEAYREGSIGLPEVNASVQSWLAHAGHADSHGLRKTIFGETVFTKEGQAA